jgi:membrane-bound metal-dependent hydrolase YbcI (DUF457 family)
MTVCVLLAAAGCHDRAPRTRSMVFNISMSAFKVEGHQVEVGFSREVWTANGATDTYDLVRSAVVGRLVVTSLVAAGDPVDYDAAINVHEDTAGVLYCREYSPYIDAAIVAP